MEIIIAQHKKIPTATCSILILYQGLLYYQTALSQYATSYGSLIVLSIRKHAMYGHMFLWFLQNNNVKIQT